MFFAIGDIHGCADELRLLLEKLPISPETTVLFLGDYIDRGPRSRQVVDAVLSLSERCNVISLMGNHEAMLDGFLREPDSAEAAAYIFNGGSSTLASYSDNHGQFEFPDSHLEFFRQLRVCYETEDNLFVHAGIPSIPIEELDPNRHGHSMIWMRDTFLRSNYPWSKVVVHGHTPVRRVMRSPNRINVDTGCVFDGYLSAIELPSERIVSVPRQRVLRRVYLQRRDCRRAAVRFRGAAPVRVRRGDRTYEFATVDYSELGLLIRSIGNSVGVELDVGEEIRGEICADEPMEVEFCGRIVRRLEDEEGLSFGVRVLSLTST